MIYYSEGIQVFRMRRKNRQPMQIQASCCASTHVCVNCSCPDLEGGAREEEEPWSRKEGEETPPFSTSWVRQSRPPWSTC